MEIKQTELFELITPSFFHVLPQSTLKRFETFC